jgi:ferredoxin-type protein NapG
MTGDDAASQPRRDFFRDSLARMLGPLADLIEPRVAPPAVRWLRPPGAIDESAFLDTCHRCGKCVEVCPADAIVPLRVPGLPANNTPIIDANETACVVCDGLQCTQVCPSGALLPLTHPRQINMGRAEVSADLCLRRHGDDCTICADECPLGAEAITATHPGKPLVLDGCVGCGVCQQACPTRPRAIVVTPIRLLPGQTGR